MRFSKQRRYEACGALVFAAMLTIVARGSERVEPVPPAVPPPLPGETSPVQSKVPQANPRSHPEGSCRAGQSPREQLVIVRAESVVWNDGSLGCPEPGMEYTQALINGYWVVIEAAGQTYDFRVDARRQIPVVPGGARPSAATAERFLSVGGRSCDTRPCI